jgi:hypothetical protein
MYQLLPTHGLFIHETRPISFSLVVDNFGVKYVGREHAQHLVDTLAAKYNITTDWDGQLYCGITLRRDYINHTVTLFMPGYIAKALQWFLHSHLKKPEHAPHKSVTPQYGAAVQYTEEPDSTHKLPKEGIKCVQAIVCVLLFYAQAIDNTMFVTLNDIAAAQANATEHTAEATVKLLNYAATSERAVGSVMRRYRSNTC